MIATIDHQGKIFRADLSKPLDISIPLRQGPEGVTAFHIPPMRMEPFSIGTFTGAVAAGAGCNVNNIHYNPHGNGTHTETIGHITTEAHPVSEVFERFFFTAILLTANPTTEAAGDRVITLKDVQPALAGEVPEAVIIRTLPNTPEKMSMQYSGSNPAYLHHEAAAALAKRGVQHLLLDVPSVDREEDGGKLLAHHAWWQQPAAPRTGATITELIYVPNHITDGAYLLNMMVPGIHNDATASKPILYAIL
jgi:kynurenine formamidase